MPSERDRKIEELLRDYARQRREQAGAPLELHPATRRLLQAEAARQYARPAPKQRWWSVASPFLWPRLALACSILIALGIGVWALLQPTDHGLRLAKVDPSEARPDLLAKAEPANTRDEKARPTPMPPARSSTRAFAEQPTARPEPESAEGIRDNTIAPAKLAAADLNAEDRRKELPAALAEAEAAPLEPDYAAQTSAPRQRGVAATSRARPAPTAAPAASPPASAARPAEPDPIAKARTDAAEPLARLARAVTTDSSPVAVSPQESAATNVEFMRDAPLVAQTAPSSAPPATPRTPAPPAEGQTPAAPLEATSLQARLVPANTLAAATSAAEARAYSFAQQTAERRDLNEKTASVRAPFIDTNAAGTNLHRMGLALAAAERPGDPREASPARTAERRGVPAALDADEARMRDGVPATGVLAYGATSPAVAVEVPAAVRSERLASAGRRASPPAPASSPVSRGMFSRIVSTSRFSFADRYAGPGDLLASFQVEQDGDLIRFFESDGSVYEGQIGAHEPALPGKSEAKAKAGELTARPEESGLRESILQPEPRADGWDGRSLPFRVSGTSRRLNQYVIIDGTLFSGLLRTQTNGTADLPGRASETSGRDPGKAPVVDPMPLLVQTKPARPVPAGDTNLLLEAPQNTEVVGPPTAAEVLVRVRGQARISGTNQIEIDAIRVRR